ncbi:MAG: type VI secretion system tube protein Hcp [Pseudomonadota bacterium]
MFLKPIKIMACCAILAAPLSASAATDYYLSFEGIAGGSVDENHKGAIDIRSFSWGLSVTVDSRGGTGLPGFSDFAWTQASDIAVPTLFVTAAQGKHIPTAVLDLVESSGGRKPFSYLTMTFDDVVLTNLTLGGNAGSAPSVSGSFSYGKVALKVTPQKADGTPGTPVTGTWDLVKHSGDLFSGSPLPLMQIANPYAPVAAPVPEPETWAMFLAGLGMLGLVARRHARQPLLR